MARPGATLLELGAGGGSFASHLKRRFRLTLTDQARAALLTAAHHCRPGGLVALLPDHVRETFESGTGHGGHDAADGGGLRYLEWTWDPDPVDDTYVVDYAFMLRSASGDVRLEHERHLEGLFSRSRWAGVAGRDWSERPGRA